MGWDEINFERAFLFICLFVACKNDTPLKAKLFYEANFFIIIRFASQFLPM